MLTIKRRSSNILLNRDISDIKMKYMNFKNRSSLTILFVVCVVFYLFLSIGSPLLHNHDGEERHHKDCPACDFLIQASFFTAPFIELFKPLLYRTNFDIILNKQFFSQDHHGQLFLGRAPPAIS